MLWLDSSASVRRWRPAAWQSFGMFYSRLNPFHADVEPQEAEAVLHSVVIGSHWRAVRGMFTSDPVVLGLCRVGDNVLKTSWEDTSLAFDFTTVGVCAAS